MLLYENLRPMLQEFGRTFFTFSIDSFQFSKFTKSFLIHLFKLSSIISSTCLYILTVAKSFLCQRFNFDVLLSESFQKLYEILAFHRSLYIIDLLDLHKLRARICERRLRQHHKPTKTTTNKTTTQKTVNITQYQRGEKFLDSLWCLFYQREILFLFLLFWC